MILAGGIAARSEYAAVNRVMRMPVTLSERGHDGVVEDRLRFEGIDWHLFLNTRDSRAASKIIQRIGKLIGTEMETVSLTSYWKDSALTDAWLRSEFGPTSSPAEATFALMETVNRLTHGFQTSGPQRFEGGKVEFVLLSAAGFVEPGVNWMEASIRNFDSSRRTGFDATDELSQAGTTQTAIDGAPSQISKGAEG